MPTKGPKPQTLRALFWPKVDRRGPTECWPWLAYIQPNGYAKFRWDCRTWQAHRLAYELLVGQIPPGMTVDHLCRNQACCNPAHMEIVTSSVNAKRALAKRYEGKTHCAQGHERSSENTIVRKDGRRECRVCDNERSRRAYEENRDERRAKMRAAYYARKSR